MMKSSFLAIALASVYATPPPGLSETDKPYVIDQTNFYGTVIDLETQNTMGSTPWFLEFYSPYCPHCQHLAPTWDELFTRSKDQTYIGRVDCTAKDGRPLCTKYKVTGYPTLLYMAPGSHEAVKYDGKRNLDDFEEFMME